VYWREKRAHDERGHGNFTLPGRKRERVTANALWSSRASRD